LTTFAVGADLNLASLLFAEGRGGIGHVRLGLTLVAEESPFVAFGTVLENANAILTTFAVGADLNLASLLFAEDGGWIGYVGLVCGNPGCGAGTYK
jgi:hypothetical protein